RTGYGRAGPTMAQSDGRKTCVLFLSCWGGRPKYFLQLSDDFRRRYRIVPYLWNDGSLLASMYAGVEKQLEHADLLIYEVHDSRPGHSVLLGPQRPSAGGGPCPVPTAISRATAYDAVQYQ